jgi:serralysin
MLGRRFLMTRRLAAAAVTAALVVAVPLSIASAAPGNAGFRTSQAPMMAPVAAGVTVTPIITVGDTLSSGYRFDSIPDGISMDPRGNGRVDLYINHETSTVPFPIAASAAAWQPTTSGNGTQNDFDNAHVSKLALNQKSMGVTQGWTAIPGSSNYERFCSNFLATSAQGFSRDMLFTNEETNDFVNRSGTAYPAATSEPPSEQAGVVVALDVQSGQYRSIYGMGRTNHENSVAVPGYGHPVLLTTDDTFTSNPAQSQLYQYSAASSDAVWNDQGALYGFKSTTAGVNSYYDFPVGSSMSITGQFVALDPAAAHGTQNALEADSGAKGVFRFVRLEDVAYDRTDPNIVYLADTGRGSASTSGNPFASTNGRIWKMVLDPADATNVLSLSILVDGDAALLKDPTAIHQPDNLETTTNGHLLVTEDPGSGNQFATTDPSLAATSARLWMVDTTTAAKSVVAKVDQSADGPSGTTDVDGFAPGNLGSWESTGVVDASSIFGDGAFLINVQAHTLWLQTQASGDTATWTGPFTPFTSGADGQPDWLYKREGGQLLLIRIPGA